MKQVSCDYCFMRDQPGSESAKILVSKDRATRMVSAHVVPAMRARFGTTGTILSEKLEI